MPPRGGVLDQEPAILAPNGQSARKVLALANYRSYVAGQLSGPNQNYRPRTRSADAEIKQGVKHIIARCRDQARNNPSIRGGIRRIANNVVRRGIKPQFQFRNADDRLDSAVNIFWERMFARWSRYADLTGKLSYWRMQRLGLSQMWSDGGFFIHRAFEASIPGVVPLRLELIERDHLDLTIDGQLQNGNIARQGKEFDDQGRCVAYHLYRSHPGDYQGGIAGQRSVRYAATDIIDVYDRERISQTMGLPWLVAVVMESYNLEEYRDYVKIAAKLETAFALFVKSSSPDLGHPGIGLQQVPGQPAASEWPTSWADMPDYIEPGRIQSLPYGTDIVSPSHNKPGTQYEPFVKESRRTQSAGMGMSYEAYANDHSDASYSSTRSGSLEERLSYGGMQQFLNEEMGDRVCAWFVEAAWMAGLNPQPMPDFAWNPWPYLEAVSQQDPGWTWVDPLKDGQASKLKVDNILSTRRREAAAQGADFDELLEEAIEEETLLTPLYELRAQNQQILAPIIPAKGAAPNAAA